MKSSPSRRPRADQHRRTNEASRRKYYSARWARLRLVVLARDNGLCQECLRAGRTTPGNQIDHIARAEENQELFWRTDNLQTLCSTCHSRKTIAETNHGRN